MINNGPLDKHVKSFGPPYMIMVGLNRNRLSRDLEKAQDVAYLDVLNEFDSSWGVKGLIVTLRVIKWSRGRLGSKWVLFLDFASVCVGPPVASYG